MKGIRLASLLALTFWLTCSFVCAQDGAGERSKPSRQEISRFLGKWTGTHEQLVGRAMHSRPFRMEVFEVKEDGRRRYRASVFMGIIKPNVGMLRTQPPLEKECKVRFEQAKGVAVMKLKIHKGEYEFVLKGETLEGSCTNNPWRTASLTRP